MGQGDKLARLGPPQQTQGHKIYSTLIFLCPPPLCPPHRHPDCRAKDAAALASSTIICCDFASSSAQRHSVGVNCTTSEGVQKIDCFCGRSSGGGEARTNAYKCPWFHSDHTTLTASLAEPEFFSMKTGRSSLSAPGYQKQYSASCRQSSRSRCRYQQPSAHVIPRFDCPSPL